MDVLNQIIQESPIGSLSKWSKSIVLSVFSSIVLTLFSMLIAMIVGAIVAFAFFPLRIKA